MDSIATNTHSSSIVNAYNNNPTDVVKTQNIKNYTPKVPYMW